MEHSVDYELLYWQLVDSKHLSAHVPGEIVNGAIGSFYRWHKEAHMVPPVVAAKDIKGIQRALVYLKHLQPHKGWQGALELLPVVLQSYQQQDAFIQKMMAKPAMWPEYIAQMVTKCGQVYNEKSIYESVKSRF